jgi:hypothetical protein
MNHWRHIIGLGLASFCDSAGAGSGEKKCKGEWGSGGRVCRGSSRLGGDRGGAAVLLEVVVVHTPGRCPTPFPPTQINSQTPQSFINQDPILHTATCTVSLSPLFYCVQCH